MSDYRLKILLQNINEKHDIYSVKIGKELSVN